MYFFLRNNLKIFFSSVNNYDNCNVLVISKMEFEFLITYIYIYIERIRVLQNAREVIGTSRRNKLKR